VGLAVFRGASGMGDPFRRGFDAERQWLHSHAERGNDHQLSSGDAGRGNDQRSGRDAGRRNYDHLIIRHTKKRATISGSPFFSSGVSRIVESQ
jgi:hypothetical protein